MTDSVLVIALAGHANVGKTSLVSALTRDATLLVDEKAGTTTASYDKTFSIAGEEVLRFVDTPGFEFVSRINRWLDEQGDSAGPDGRTRIRAFLDAGVHDRHALEKEALRGVLAADVIAYVADVSLAPEGQVVQEVRLLRRAGVPMIGVLNNLHAGADPAGWVDMLRLQGVDNIVQLDALRFPADQEAGFYRALSVLRPEQASRLDRVQELRAQLDDELLVSSALVVGEVLVDCLAYRREERFGSDDEAKKARSGVNRRFQEALREREARGFRDLARVYGFGGSQVEGGELDVPTWSGAVTDDLFDADAIKRYGVSAGTLGAVGAVTGSLLDAVGGFGIGTVLGGGMGVAAGLLLGRQVSTRIEAGTVVVGPVDAVQFPSVLLNRALACWMAVRARSHADRSRVEVRVDPERLDAREVGGLIRKARSCSKHPEWSAIDGRGDPDRARAVRDLAKLAEQLLRKQRDAATP